MNRYTPTPAGNILDTTTGREVCACGNFTAASRTARTLNRSLQQGPARPSRLARLFTTTIAAMNLYPATTD